MTIKAWQPSKVVVGVDGSESAIEALRWAASVCGGTDAAIIVVTCWMFPTSAGMGGYTIAAYSSELDLSGDATQILAMTLKAAFGDDVPKQVTTLVKEGHPSQVLIDESNDADLLVIGTRGHGGFAGLLLGSVSGHCAEHANCPVTVVRTPSTTDRAAAASS